MPPRCEICYIGHTSKLGNTIWLLILWSVHHWLSSSFFQPVCLIITDVVHPNPSRFTLRWEKPWKFPQMKKERFRYKNFCLMIVFSHAHTQLFVPEAAAATYFMSTVASWNILLPFYRFFLCSDVNYYFAFSFLLNLSLLGRVLL